MAENTPPAELTALIDTKKKEQKETHRSHWLSGSAKTAIGAVGGFAAGTAAWTLGAYNTLMSAVRSHMGTLIEHAEKIKDMPVSQQQRATEEIGEKIGMEMLDHLKNSRTLSATVMRNPLAVVAAGTAFGGAFMLTRHNRKETAARQKIDGEVQALESTAQAWAKRVEKVEEPTAEAVITR